MATNYNSRKTEGEVLKAITTAATRFLTKDDCAELYYSLDETTLQAKIGPDGALLAAGQVQLTEAERSEAREHLQRKIERLQAGFYDEYHGECDRPRSITGKWIAHLQWIQRTLAADSGNLDVAFYFIPLLFLASAVRHTWRILNK